MNNNILVIFSLVVGFFCQSSLAVDISSVPFWQLNSGQWFNDNTYLSDKFEHRIKSYSVVSNIVVTKKSVNITERRFYPPGGFNADYVGLKIPKDQGIEFIQMTSAKPIDDSGDVIFSSEGLPESNTTTKITPLTDDTALLTVTNNETSLDKYRMFISLPNSVYRYVMSLGLVDNPNSAEKKSGSLRGVSISYGTKLTDNEVARRVEGLRKKFNIINKVIFLDGKYQLIKISE